MSDDMPCSHGRIGYCPLHEFYVRRSDGVPIPLEDVDVEIEGSGESVRYIVDKSRSQSRDTREESSEGGSSGSI